MKGREQILRVHAAGKPIANTVDLAQVAKRTPASPVLTWRTS